MAVESVALPQTWEQLRAITNISNIADINQRNGDVDCRCVFSTILVVACMWVQSQTTYDDEFA